MTVVFPDHSHFFQGLATYNRLLNVQWKALKQINLPGNTCILLFLYCIESIINLKQISLKV